MPRAIDPLVRRFLIAEAQLNYGQAQSDAETEAFLGLDLRPVDDGEAFLLEPDRYQADAVTSSVKIAPSGRHTCRVDGVGVYAEFPHRLGLQVFTAPHKKGVPAASYGSFRRKSRLKEEFQGLDKRKLGALVREDVADHGALRPGRPLLLGRHDHRPPPGAASGDPAQVRDGHPRGHLSGRAVRGPRRGDAPRAKGHTHHAQLHPWIAAFPRTTFVLVHWSLRYSKEEVLAFFDKSYGGVPKNVVLWIWMLCVCHFLLLTPSGATACATAPRVLARRQSVSLNPIFSGPFSRKEFRRSSRVGRLGARLARLRYLILRNPLPPTREDDVVLDCHAVCWVLFTEGHEDRLLL